MFNIIATGPMATPTRAIRLTEKSKNLKRGKETKQPR